MAVALLFILIKTLLGLDKGKMILIHVLIDKMDFDKSETEYHKSIKLYLKVGVSVKKRGGGASLRCYTNGVTSNY